MATRAERRVPARTPTTSRIPQFLPEPLEGRRLLSVALLDPAAQPRFINPLPIPAIAEPTSIEMDGMAHYDIAATQFQQNLGLVNPTTGQPLATTVWGYGGTYPGPTIVAHQDQPIMVRWINDLVRDPATDRTPLPPLLPLDTSIHWADPTGMGHMPGEPYTGPVPMAVHLHGSHTRDDSDGHPDAWYTPDGPDADSAPDYTGPLYNETYTYENDQQPTTLWYHDHGLGVGRLNVYAGLAGMYLLRGRTEDALNLPSGAYEIPLVIQDRMFTADGQLYLPSDPPPGTTATYPSIQQQFFGDVIVVNGMAWPTLDVEPRQYRFRMVNGSDSRFYTLSLSNGQSVSQIGTDGGLLDAPVARGQVTIAPGERADVVIDFSNPALAGQTIVFRNSAAAPFGGATPPDPSTVGQVMAFRVSKPLSSPDTSAVPASLRDMPIMPPAQNGPTRNVVLFSPTDEYGRTLFLLGAASTGPRRFHDSATEVVKLGDTEVWEIRNNTAATHPVHIHLVQFQVLSRKDRQGQTVTGEFDAGLKDTVRVGPGETVRVIATFDRAGEYVWHCHMLSHEDHDMMRPLVVAAPTASEVVGRQVFYDNSAFDGRSAAIDARDDAAVATDKQALLPMQTATFANLTSFSRGINGLFLDVRNLPATAAALSPADFVFKAGLTGDPAMWPDAPPPTSVTVRRGAGANGSDRVTLAWPDSAIKNRWLRVQVLANGRTGLTSPDVFYFGNLAGETGNVAATGGFAVSATDLRATRARLFSRNAPITNRYDFNRDGRVNSLDLLTVRLNLSASLPALMAPHDMGGMMTSPMTAAMLAVPAPLVGPAVPMTPQPPSLGKTQCTTCPCCGAAHNVLTC